LDIFVPAIPGQTYAFQYCDSMPSRGQCACGLRVPGVGVKPDENPQPDVSLPTLLGSQPATRMDVAEKKTTTNEAVFITPSEKMCLGRCKIAKVDFPCMARTKDLFAAENFACDKATPESTPESTPTALKAKAQEETSTNGATTPAALKAKAQEETLTNGVKTEAATKKKKKSRQEKGEEKEEEEKEEEAEEEEEEQEEEEEAGAAEDTDAEKETATNGANTDAEEAAEDEDPEEAEPQEEITSNGFGDNLERFFWRNHRGC